MVRGLALAAAAITLMAGGVEAQYSITATAVIVEPLAVDFAAVEVSSGSRGVRIQAAAPAATAGGVLRRTYVSGAAGPGAMPVSAWSASADGQRLERRQVRPSAPLPEAPALLSGAGVEVDAAGGAVVVTQMVMANA